MGVRLVVHNAFVKEIDYTGTSNHDEIIHRDWLDQHPIYAITGLQEVLNTIELNIITINEILVQQRQDLIDYTDDNVNALNLRIDNVVDTFNNIIAALHTIESTVDSNSIHLDYDATQKSLTADVKIFNDANQNNILMSTDYGLFVPRRIVEDTPSIKWSEESFGQTLRQLYDDGLRFSHDGSWSNVASVAEMNAWYWDSTLNSFVQPNNTGTYNGFVSTYYFDNYRHTVRLLSTDTDDDVNGVIIGFVFDADNHPHTLSALVQRGGGMGANFRFAIIYDFCLPDQTIVTSYNLANSSNGWNNYANGITLYVTKYENLISVSATAWGYNNTISSIDAATSISFESTLSIDLNNYSWGHFFKGLVRYGYSNISQANSYFDHAYFHSLTKTDSIIMKANVKLSSTAHNSLVVKDDGLYNEEFIISPDSRNVLTHRSNGYYVQGFGVSSNRLNGLYDAGSGYYYVHKSHSFIDVTQTNHGFAVGDFIYYDNRTSLYKKAIAIDDFDINIVGMVSYVTNTNTFEYVCSGFVETNVFTTTNGYIQGMPLYISDTEAGKVTQDQPDISKAVGYPVANKGLIISIERGIQYNQEAKIGDFKRSTNTYNIRSDGFIRIVPDVQYKQTLITQLINTVSADFKSNYMTFNNTLGTVSFKNVDNLKIENGCGAGVQLFIKAF